MIQLLADRYPYHEDLRLDGLAAREQSVLRGILSGLSNRKIADQIGVSEGTVKATLQQLFKKTGVRNLKPACEDLTRRNGDQPDGHIRKIFLHRLRRDTVPERYGRATRWTLVLAKSCCSVFLTVLSDISIRLAIFIRQTLNQRRKTLSLASSGPFVRHCRNPAALRQPVSSATSAIIAATLRSRSFLIRKPTSTV